MYNTNYGNITQQELEEMGYIPIPKRLLQEAGYIPQEEQQDEETTEQLSNRNN